MKYNIDLEQYAKEAYDKYMNDNGFQDLKDVETVQDLTFNVKVEPFIPSMASALISLVMLKLV